MGDGGGVDNKEIVNNYVEEGGKRAALFDTCDRLEGGRAGSWDDNGGGGRAKGEGDEGEEMGGGNLGTLERPEWLLCLGSHRPS